jgi:predicted PurR-regulated permease PerM
MEQVNWQRRRDILLSIVCIGIIIWFAWNLFLNLFVHAVLLLILSMALAFLITPGVNLLEKYKIPRLLGTLVMYIIVLVVVFLLFSALAFTLIQQVLSFRVVVTSFFITLPDQFQYMDKFLVQKGIPQANIDDAINQVKGQLLGFAQSAATNVVNVAFIVTNAFIDILLILVLSFYFTLDGRNIRKNLKGIIPERSLKTAEVFEDALNRVVGNYIRGQLSLAAIICVLAGVGCYFLGLSGYALIIAFLGFLFETIPMVGPALATIPAVLISLILPDPFPRTIWIIVYFVILQMVESNILGPRIVGHAVGLHPIAAILCLIVGVQLFGAFGALLATPIVAAAWVVTVSLYNSAKGKTADEMLEHRRKPMYIRTPDIFSRRKRKMNSNPADEARVNVRTGDSDEEANRRNSSFPAQRSSIPPEDVDLLLPVPDTKEPHSGNGPQPASETVNEEL